MEFTVTWRELLIAVILATLVYLMETLLFNRRRRVEQAGTISTAQRIDQELRELRESLTNVRRRLDAMEQILAKPPEPRPEVEDSPYGQAVRLARQGLSSQDLATRCGISRGEAELIIALNRSETA